MQIKQQQIQVENEVLGLEREVADNLEELEQTHARIVSEAELTKRIRSEMELTERQLRMAKEVIFDSEDLGDFLNESLAAIPQPHKRARPDYVHGDERGSRAGTPMSNASSASNLSCPQSPRTPVVHSTVTDAPVRRRRHYFEAHTTRLPALASHRCTVCTKSISFGSKTVKCTQCVRVIHTHCMAGVALDCQPPPFGSSRAKKRKLPLFGCNLLKDVDGFSASGRVPAIVEDCLSALDRRGLLIEGVYGVPMEPDEVGAVRDSFFNGGKRPNMMTVANIHMVAAVLLRFLMDLDEPLLTLEKYKVLTRFCSAVAC
jgi:hypothetical protein